MIYIFDCNSLSNILNHYYQDRFPSFWDKFDAMVEAVSIISVREVGNELSEKFAEEKIERLKKQNENFFRSPTPEELSFITEIYSIKHFQQNLDKKRILKGGYFADPFIIAAAKVTNGTVVSEEEIKPNAARIPNICAHFEIHCIKLEGFLTEMDWKF